MNSFKAGRFTLTLSDPYPIWGALATNDTEVELRFSHHDLIDLHHVLSRAIAECRRELKERSSEVD